MHLFWLVLFVPAAILGQWVWPILKQKSIWSLSLMIVAGLIIAWLAMGLPTLGSDERNFAGVLKMFAFRLVGFTDLPLVQLLTACSVGWLRSSGSKLNIVRNTPSGHEPESPSNERLA